MKRITAFLLAFSCVLPAADPEPKRAKNVILFLADAGGIPTLNAASILAHNAPQKLFVQNWPHMGLSDTTPAAGWVTDSAAGMTAIVTGQKTHNGVISQAADTVRGKQDGTRLKTILEYAEERGLSTGVISNVNIADATPAACYAHANDRKKFGDIFLEIFSPRFGDGVDVVIGRGRKQIYAAVDSMAKDLDSESRKNRRTIYNSAADVPEDTKRPIAVTDAVVDLEPAVRVALRALSANAKGYFLMIESDAHTDNPEAGLQRLVAFDKLIRQISGIVDTNDTLLLFTADHSFDFRIRGGGPEKPLLTGFASGRSRMPARRPPISVCRSCASITVTRVKRCLSQRWGQARSACEASCRTQRSFRS